MAAQALAAFGNTLKAYGQWRASEAQADALNDLADQIIESGSLDASDFVKRASSQLAESRAARAVSGVQLNTGTSLLIDEQSVAAIIEGRQRIIQQAERQARARQKEARATKTAGRLQAIGTILSSASQGFGGG